MSMKNIFKKSHSGKYIAITIFVVLLIYNYILLFWKTTFFLRLRPVLDGVSSFLKENIMSEYTSQEVGELAKALINVQCQLQPVTKDANNPFTN